MAFQEQESVDGWLTYSNWIDELRNGSDTLEAYDADSNFRRKLLACGSNLDRFKLIWDDKALVEAVNKVYLRDSASCRRKQESRVPSSAEESKRRRDLGNKFFKDNQYMEALKSYTQAIRYAPYPDSVNKDDSLALALANRSAALYALNRYRLCILDIDLAIKYGFPEANMFKLLIRKVKSLHVLSIWANDVEQIKQNLKNILTNSETKDFIKIEIQNMFKFLEQTQPEDVEKEEPDIVDETAMRISNASKTVSQAADCVEMSYDSDRGRYLIVNKDVSFGRLLVAEEPFVCNLAPQKRDLYCYNCLGRLHDCGLGCKKCTQVIYCSEECLFSQVNLHSYECDGFLDFQEKIGIAYLVTHIMFKINFDLNSIAIYSKKTSDNKTLEEVLNIDTCQWPDFVYKNSYSSVLSLLDHSQDYGYDELMGFTLTAVYLMKALVDKFSARIPELAKPEAQVVFGSVILRHLLQLQTNVISILNQDFKGLVSKGHAISGFKEIPIGVGIYPTISLLNHSCSPNIFTLFYRNKFVGRASSSIDCGSEINYCYGPSVNRMAKKDRQQRLKEQYFFLCKCKSCEKNIENENNALLCPDCQGPVIYNRDLTNRCLKCKSENHIDTQVYLNKLASMKELIDELSRSDSDDFKDRMEKLEKLEVDLAKLVYWRNPLFTRIKTELSECAEAMEDSDKALSYCLAELDLCERTYGQDSYESIMTRLKLINIRWQHLYNCIEDAATENEREAAFEDLNGLLTVINQTRGKLKELLASTNIMNAEASFDSELKFLSEIQTSINRYMDSALEQAAAAVNGGDGGVDDDEPTITELES